jgi:hypothetical protein
MRYLLLLGALGACHDAAKPPATPPEVSAAITPARPAPCGDDAFACLHDRLAACGEGHHAWQIDVALMGMKMPIRVADTGTAWFSMMGVEMWTANGRQGLDCVAGCPTEHGPADVCVPLEFPVDLDVPAPADCDLAGTDGPAWHGHATRQVTCKDVTATFVPDLRDVRDALVDAGLFKPGTMLEKAGGLVVAATVIGVDDWTIEDVSDTTCAAVVPPSTAKAFIQPADVARAKEILAQQMPKMQAELKPKMQAMMDSQMQPALLAAVGEKCLGKRDHYEAAEVEACVKAHPDRKITQEDYQALAKKILPMVQGLMKTIDMHDVMRRQIEEPVCRAIVAAHP